MTVYVVSARRTPAMSASWIHASESERQFCVWLRACGAVEELHSATFQVWGPPGHDPTVYDPCPPAAVVLRGRPFLVASGKAVDLPDWRFVPSLTPKYVALTRRPS